MSEVAVQKFSFPFTCSPHCPPLANPSQRCDSSWDARVDPQPSQDRPDRRSPTTEKTASVHNGHQTTEAPTPPHRLNGEGAPTPTGQASPVPAVTARAMENEEPRPSAKRQLSSESVTRSVPTVKKSAVRAGATSLPGPRGRQCPAGALGSKRRPRRHLFPSTDVFQKVDAQAIGVGRELKEQLVFVVPTIAQSVTQGARSELDKLRAIWVWLCHNIEYDVSGYLGMSEKLCMPQEVVAAGRGVCCGYSTLCVEMCREMGIECQEVSGFSKGIGHQQGQSLQNTTSDHMWNAVRLAGQWYLLDACWGAGRVNMENKTFVKKFDDFYFLTDPEEFIDSHFPDEESWQLLDRPVTLKEFEKRALKTSAFYNLGLTLLQPKYFHLVTDDGEATVSIGFSRPMTFTYQISSQGAKGRAQDVGEVSSSSGLLTVSHQVMKLRLLPPAAGTYDVLVFARPPAATTPFSWVCSFTLECPRPRASEELPKNPFMSWGLQATAEALGLKGSSQGSEVATVDEGTFELLLETSRPLMVLCELVHASLEPTLAKRCVATQIEPDRLTCHVLCPSRGFYRLSVFVRDYDQPDKKFQNAGNFLLQCQKGEVDVKELFPPNLGSSCGPGVRTLGAGLSKFSHTGALVSTTQGKCNITFHNQNDLELHAVLSRAEPSTHPLARYLFFTHTDTKVTLSVTLPQAGLYRLGLYAKTAPGNDFNPLCDFIVRNTSEQAGSPFPGVFSAWRKGCVLFEPRGGVLEPLSRVRFRVRVPGAQRVSVVGETMTELKLNKSRVWEGEVFTENAGPELKMAAVLGESTDMAVMMTFDILNKDNKSC